MSGVGSSEQAEQPRAEIPLFDSSRVTLDLATADQYRTGLSSFLSTEAQTLRVILASRGVKQSDLDRLDQEANMLTRRRGKGDEKTWAWLGPTFEAVRDHDYRVENIIKDMGYKQGVRLYDESMTKALLVRVLTPEEFAEAWEEGHIPVPNVSPDVKQAFDNNDNQKLSSAMRDSLEKLPIMRESSHLRRFVNGLRRSTSS